MGLLTGISGASGYGLWTDNGFFTGAISGGTIDIGGADATSFHVDSAGNIWSGASTYAAAPFRVSSGGALVATSAVVGIVAGGANLMLNSTFQVDTDANGTADYWAGYTTGGQTVVLDIVATGGVDNRAFQRVSWSVTNTGQKGIATDSDQPGGVQGGWLANTTYIVSFWAKTTNLVGGGISSMNLYWFTDPATQTAINNPALSTTWQQYIFRITWGASVNIKGGLYISILSGAGVTGNVCFDHVQVQQADTPSAWAPYPSELEPGSVTAEKISVTSLSAIKADMGTLTAGSIVIGSTNKLWLNDSADGALNIGGSTKASAPFRVTAAGVLTATSGTIGGWTLSATALTAGSSTTTVGLDSGGTNPAFYAGSATPADAKIQIGVAGIKIKTSTNDKYFLLDNTSITGTRPIGFLNMDQADPPATDRGMINLGHWVDANNYSALACYTDTVSMIVSRGGVWKNLLQGNFYYCRIENPIRMPTGAGIAAENQNAQLYVSTDGNFVIQWLSGGVTRYKYIALTDTSTTWSYSTSAPA